MRKSTVTIYIVLAFGLIGCSSTFQSTNSSQPTAAPPPTPLGSQPSPAPTATPFTIAPAPSNFALTGAAAVPLAQCPNVTGETSSWCSTNWPPAASGAVYNYTVTETRVATGTVLNRNAYVYQPSSITATAAPLLVFLHGGTSSAEQLFSSMSFAQYADGRSNASPSGWDRNSATCKLGPLASSNFGLGGTSVLGFTSDGTNTGSVCSPNLFGSYSAPASLPFYVVYPNGLNHHWEDGRWPSPGYFNTSTDENRDDVGFVNFLIAIVKSQQGHVDASRVYVGGMSNGGIMTTRLMCNQDNPLYPELQKVAAFSVSIASMAAPLYSGTYGRTACPAVGQTVTPTAIFVGYNSPTPNAVNDGVTTMASGCNPYNSSTCTTATVSGDSIMPYGTRSTGDLANIHPTGGVFTLNSPDLGQVVAATDNQLFWYNHFLNSGAGSPVYSFGSLGYYTTFRHYNFTNSSAVFQIFETDSGLHYNLSTRFDFTPVARIYDFLFSFSRNSDGTIVNSSTYNSGNATYGNLSGTY